MIVGIFLDTFFWYVYFNRYDWFGSRYDEKNLSCKNLGEAQRNMIWFIVFVLVFVNLLFLYLGSLLYNTHL